jgi:nucleoredoxin
MVEEGKEVEIIFASSDSDQHSFDEYYGSMPWAAIPFSSSNIKQALSSKYGVRGIPSLIVLNNNGETVDANGRNTVVGAKGNTDQAWGAWCK